MNRLPLFTVSTDRAKMMNSDLIPCGKGKKFILSLH